MQEGPDDMNVLWSKGPLVGVVGIQCTDRKTHALSFVCCRGIVLAQFIVCLGQLSLCPPYCAILMRHASCALQPMDGTQ